MPRDETHILYMLLAGRRIIRSVAGTTRTAFDSDSEKRDSVVLQLGNMGEAATRLSQQLRAAHGEIPWSDIIGMRHRLFHGYEVIDWDVVWIAASRDVPRVLIALEKLLPPAAIR